MTDIVYLKDFVSIDAKPSKASLLKLKEEDFIHLHKLNELMKTTLTPECDSLVKYLLYLNKSQNALRDYCLKNYVNMSVLAINENLEIGLKVSKK